MIETRQHDINHGLDSLCRALSRYHGQRLPALLDMVLAELIDDDRDDDIAVLAVRAAEFI